MGGVGHGGCALGDYSGICRVVVISTEMPTTPAQINTWRKAPTESEGLEFKEAKRGLNNADLFKYCVGIANAGGGRLLLGIADKPPRPVVGTSACNNPKGMAKKIYDTTDLWVEVEEVKHPDGRVVVFHVPPCPPATPYQYKGAFWTRMGGSLTPMRLGQLLTILAIGKPDWLEQPALEKITGAEVIELLDTQRFFELINLPYPDNREGVLGRLAQERLVEKTGSNYTIPRICAILLGKRLTIFPPELARKAPRVVVYSGVSKMETKLDQPWDKGYATGFQGLVEFAMSQLPQNEVIENALRKEIKLVPEIAIRELIANALVHQDFTLSGMGVMVEIYADRVEISNPGEPTVPVDRFIDGYQSRNERLTNLMRRFAICEEKGSGIDNVINIAEVYQLPAPDFRSTYQRTEVALFGYSPFDQMDSDARVRACYQHCALQYVLHRRMTNRSLRLRFKLPESKSEAVSRAIRDANKAGKIRIQHPEQKSLRYRSYVPFWA